MLRAEGYGDSIEVSSEGIWCEGCQQHHAVTGLAGHLRDAGAHEAGADHEQRRLTQVERAHGGRAGGCGGLRSVAPGRGRRQRRIGVGC